MRHLRTPTVWASKYPASAAMNFSGGTRAMADRTAANGRKWSNTPSTASAATHRRAMIVQPRALRRVRPVSIMKGNSQTEGYRKTRRFRDVRPPACRLVNAAPSSSAEDFVDFACEREIEITDAFD